MASGNTALDNADDTRDNPVQNTRVELGAHAFAEPDAALSALRDGTSVMHGPNTWVALADQRADYSRGYTAGTLSLGGDYRHVLTDSGLSSTASSGLRQMTVSADAMRGYGDLSSFLPVRPFQQASMQVGGDALDEQPEAMPSDFPPASRPRFEPGAIPSRFPQQVPQYADYRAQSDQLAPRWPGRGMPDQMQSPQPNQALDRAPWELFSPTQMNPTGLPGQRGDDFPMPSPGMYPGRFPQRMPYEMPGAGATGFERPGAWRPDNPDRQRTGEIFGPSRMTAQQIDAVLARYRSPVAGRGQDILERCEASGIKAEYALAFFVKESSAGTAGVAARSKSWGNIVGTGPAGREGNFQKYNDFIQGLESWCNLIHAYHDKHNLQTLPSQVSRYLSGHGAGHKAQYVQQVRAMVHDFTRASDLPTYA